MAILALALAGLAVWWLVQGIAHGEPDGSWVRARGVLRIGSDLSYPPFGFVDERGQPAGLDVDLGRALAARLGLRAEFVNLGYDGLYDALYAGQVDVLISGLVIDPLRMDDFAYTQPYFNAGQVLVVRRDGHQHMAQGTAVIDTRTPREFAAGHIPGSYGIPLEAPLITWAGWVVPFGTPLILIADSPMRTEEAVRQLIRIGYDDLRGTLDGGIAAWEATGLPVSRVPIMPAAELRQRLERGTAPIILDVRHEAEWRTGHLPQAIHVEAGHLPATELPLPKDGNLVVHCGHADRATVAISVLERQGYRNLILLEGGFSSWQAADYPVVQER
jgi:rhodanese-related sulfurtransferase